jgi:hypothetical protein
VFIADHGNNRVRKVDGNGNISTLAGNGSGGFSGDGGAATIEKLAQPDGLAVDGSGNLYIADNGNNRIRKVAMQGPTLVLYGVSAAGAGAYNLVVSSPFGTVTSSIVTLKITLPPLTAALALGQGLQLQFQGVPGNSYVLMSAPSLTSPINWSPVITNSADSNGTWTFTVSNVLSNTVLFYRLSTTSP